MKFTDNKELTEASNEYGKAEIDGEVYSFPVYGETDKDNVGIRNLYVKTFGKQPPKNSLYNDVRMAIVYNKPI